MRRLITLAVTLGLLAAIIVGARWLWIATHVAAGYAAKVTCSLALNSGQDAAQVYRDYVSREIAPLGPVLHVAVSDQDTEASALGLLRVRAVYRRGLGCTLLPDGSKDGMRLPHGVDLPRRALDATLPWPDGGAGPAATAPPELAAAIERAFREPEPPDPQRLRQTKAVVVVQDGRLIAERYAPGYGPDKPMLSWSMAKSVTAALVGIAVADGRLALREPAPVPEWSAPSDPRHAITLDQLLRMSSGLAFDEHQGAINDVSRMLFTKNDMGAFAASTPLEAPPDTTWSYSSGTANVIARLLRDSFGGDLTAFVRYANERLFDPVGMTSAFFEPDASGTPIGSSFVFMTARDWARFGELHRGDGMWNGQRILPDGWVRYVTTPTPAAPEGRYGALWWLNAGAPNDRAQRMWPGLPTDAYAARGHSGQYVVVVPSAKLVVVRLGLSIPDDGNDGTPELVADLIRALR
jgi:CubicO group peptidase (beta-lactamase class C family)